jgi:uncharacterized protein (TIGR02145 family)
MRIFLSYLLAFFFIFSTGSGQNRIDVKDENESVKRELKTLEGVVDSLKRDLRSCKAEIDARNASINKLNNKLNDVNNRFESISKQPTSYLSEPTVTIFNQQWAKAYLSAQQLKSYVPSAFEVTTEAGWDSAYNKNLPVYCFHEFDSAKVHGVLLNIPAIRLLKYALKRSLEGWQIPDTKDIVLLKRNLEICKDRLTNLVISSNTSSPKWSKGGSDAFGWNLVPLAYRRSIGSKWFGKTFASFFYLNERDPEIKNQFSLFEIYDDTPNKIFLTEVEKISNYGVFIRLIKK